MHKEKLSPNSLAWKMKKTEFQELLCNHRDLKHGVLKVRGLAGKSLEGTLQLLEKKQANNLGADSMETVI